MKKYICIHGHFYQPPRENPWLEAIEQQDSAYPYHDWNERITAECYSPNAASRIFNGDGRIAEIVNNYAKISFNFGPTLLNWIQAEVPDVYRRILEADKESMANFSGHGSALAQVYNHLIMPLANRRDKLTQVHWGIRDFEWRFGRKPEGMWLPETAVDLETLDILAEAGVVFTILSPYQARRVRKKGDRRWHDVRGGRIDPTQAYEQLLPSGRSIFLFFYDGPISQATAFERLLTRGEDFAHRLAGAFSPRRDRAQLVHIATDGETYGHHHRFGDMALAYALRYIQSQRMAELTNYGEFLEMFPPTYQVEILENTSWSCAHGVGRWERDCGCRTGGDTEWNQAWRAPLREALDWLRDALAPRFEQYAGRFLEDPWAARDDYIQVVLDRSRDNVESFLSRHARGRLEEGDQVTVLKLLEMQRQAMLMYTSCGWFFSELSGIETVQVIEYAGRALQLAQDLFDDSVEEPFLSRLEKSWSNLPEYQNGRYIFERWVRPTTVDLIKVGAHFAISSLFEAYAERSTIYCYIVQREAFQEEQAGRAKIIVGRARIVSRITGEYARVSYAAFGFGDHHLHGGARYARSDEEFSHMRRELLIPFKRADLAQCIRVLDRQFEGSSFALRSLFRDEQRKIVQGILESSLADLEVEYRRIYQSYAPMLRFLGELGIPVPAGFKAPGEFLTNLDLRRHFEAEDLDLERIQEMLEDVRDEKLELDAAGLEFALRRNLEKSALELTRQPDDLALLQRVDALTQIAASMPFEVILRKPQDFYWDLLQDVYPRHRQLAGQGDEQAQKWVKLFITLGERLYIVVNR